MRFPDRIYPGYRPPVREKEEETEHVCDNCEQYCLFAHQIKVDTVDGLRFMCPDCAPEFQEEEVEGWT